MWGGLGSQLFGVALASDVLKKYPRRRLVLILHSSGVTRRGPEICDIFPEFEYVVMDDFSSRQRHDSDNLNQTFTINTVSRKLLRKLALIFGILSEENIIHPRSLRKWTLSVRGHYSHRKIEGDFLELLQMRLENFASETHHDYGQDVAIHYRLGDLLELSNKNSVAPDRILNVISQLTGEGDISIFSDSPEKAVSLLGEGIHKHKLHLERLSTSATIWAALQVTTFIGTSSKISYWIILLRQAANRDLVNYLPMGDKEIIERITPTISTIKYY